MFHLNHNTRKSCPSALGLTLIELLVTIAIIGILVNLSMMFFGGSSNQVAVEQKDKRNAQEIANIAAMASAAGAHYLEPGDEAATIANLRVGCTPTTGAFRGRLFKISALGEKEIQGAMRYLALNDTDLMYHMDGSR